MEGYDVWVEGEVKGIIGISLLLFFFLAGCSLSPRLQTVQIFFPDRNDLFLVPVTRVVTQRTPQSLLDELAKGPQDREFLRPVFPAGQTSPALTLRGSTIVVNFSQPPLLEKQPTIVKSLLATFQQLR